MTRASKLFIEFFTRHGRTSIAAFTVAHFTTPAMAAKVAASSVERMVDTNPAITMVQVTLNDDRGNIVDRAIRSTSRPVDWHDVVATLMHPSGSEVSM